jgi:hypothetical protein
MALSRPLACVVLTAFAVLGLVSGGAGAASADPTVPTPGIESVDGSTTFAAGGLDVLTLAGQATALQAANGKGFTNTSDPNGGYERSFVVLLVDGKEVPEIAVAYIDGDRVLEKDDTAPFNFEFTEVAVPWQSGPIQVADALSSVGITSAGDHQLQVQTVYQLFNYVPDAGDTSTHADFTKYEYRSAPSLPITVTLLADASPTEVGPTPDDPCLQPNHAGYACSVSASVSQLAADPSNPAAPSVLSALPDALSSGIFDPVYIVIAAALAAIVAAVTAFSALAFSGAGSTADRIAGSIPWMKALGKRVRIVGDRLRSLTDVTDKAPVGAWLAIVGAFVLAAIISGFLDPGFGGNAGSLRMVLSLLTIFAVQSVGGWAVIRAVVGSGGEPVTFRPSVNPGMLVVLVLAVVLSRLLGFEPGVVYGAFLGLTFGATLQGARQARVLVTGTIYVVALSFLSWVLYTVGVVFQWQDAGVGGAFALETLSGLVVAGASGLAIALLPLKSLDGGTIWAWNKVIWAVLYGVAAFYALVVLGILPYSGDAVSAPLMGWLALYAVYGLAGLVVWLVTRRQARAAAKVESDASVSG